METAFLCVFVVFLCFCTNLVLLILQSFFFLYSQSQVNKKGFFFLHRFVDTLDTLRSFFCFLSHCPLFFFCSFFVFFPDTTKVLTESTNFPKVFLSLFLFKSFNQTVPHGFVLLATKPTVSSGFLFVKSTVSK